MHVEALDYPDPKPQFILNTAQHDVRVVTYGREVRFDCPKGRVVTGVAYLRDLVLVKDGGYMFWVNKSVLTPA